MKSTWLCLLTGVTAFAGALFSSSAQAAAACSHDRLLIDGQFIATTLCSGTPAIAAGTVRLPLQAHLEGHNQSIDRALSLRFPALAPTPRAVEDIDLLPLGIAKTLHLTLMPHGNDVEIEHALLLPGPTLIR